MSLGPPNKEKFEIRTVDKIRHGLKISLAKYFKSPMYYLFYILLTATALGLFFGMEFSKNFYAVLFFLGLANFFQYAYGLWSNNKNTGAIQETDE